MQLSYSALLVAALSFEYTVAQPAHHRHHHKHRRAEVAHADSPNVEVRGLDVLTVDWSKIDWQNVHYTYPAGSPSQAPTQAPTSAPAPAPTSAPAPAATSISKPTSTPVIETPNVKDTSTPASGGPVFGASTAPKDNGNKDQYIGNVGNPYGSNMKTVAASDAGKCKYSIKFVNNGGNSKNFIIWNKSGKDGQPQSGMGSEPNMHIPLGAGESQFVCFDENSQVAFSEDCPRDPLKGNLPNCTWGEADFGDLRNGGWSGYDRSSIPNSAGNTGFLTISCPKGKASSQDYNSFTDASQEDAGGSIAPGSADLTAEWR